MLVEEMNESSSRSSSDSEEEFKARAANHKVGLALTMCHEVHPRQENYRTVIGLYSDLDFWRHFRVTRSTFNKLVDCLNKGGFRSNVIYHRGNGQPLPVNEMLYITLYYLGNQGAIRLIADKFGHCESTIFKEITEVTTFLFDNQSQFIKWPTAEEMVEIEKEFRSKRGFPGICGVLDGSHIRIHPNVKNQKAYRNYKKFHSIVLMGIVLPDKQFSYIFTGFPGSAHDSGVFGRSSLCQKLSAENCSGLLNPVNYHIIGDAAFKLSEWLLTPFSRTENLSRSEIRFNSKLSGTRVIVEQAYGDLKNRFRRLNDVHASVKHCVRYVVSSCVIHNACIQNGDFLIDRQRIPIHCDVNPLLLLDPGANEQGIRKRNRIKAMF